MNKKHLIILIIMFFIGITGVAFYYNNVNKGNDELIDCDTDKPKDTDNHEGEEQSDYVASTNNDESKDSTNQYMEDLGENESNKDSKIYVHICGQVNKPGVYELKGDARVIDAIEAAKGLTKKAASESINQAKKLEDSEQVYIPSREEVKENKYCANASLGGNNNESVSASSIQNSKSSNDDSNSGNGLKVNINTASEEELTTLPGIGTAKAKKIIAYRQSNGSFSKIEDIMKISGIKEGLFNKISANITV